jgi:hypothetical protein
MLDKAGNVSTFPFLILCVMKTPSHPGLATWKSRTYVKTWVLFCFCVRFCYFYEMKKTVLFLSILVSLFWFASQFINIYRFALVGAIFEILWLPMILMVFCLPLISFYYLLKEKFSVNSTYLYAILIMSFTFLIILFFK